VLLAPVAGAAPERPLAAGDLAADFTLADQHGRRFQLSEAVAGRDFVVLAFYVKAFTGG
jgi:peroxiredoxin